MPDFSPILRPDDVPDVTKRSTAELVEASNAFGFDLWGQLRHRRGNLAISPASIHLALAMTWAGARGATADQMAAALHLTGATAVHDAAGALLRAWNAGDDVGSELCIVNRLFGDDVYSLKDDYVELVRSRYGAPVERVDFRGAADDSRVRINDWVESATSGRIARLLAPGTIDERTRLVLVNAVTFLATWAMPFQEKDTTQRTFHGVSGDVTVPMMSQESTFLIGLADGVFILEMPYCDGDFAMTVLMPKDPGQTLESVERKLSPEALKTWLGRFANAPVQVQLPRFTLEPPDALSLRPVLADLGMTAAFGPQADFTGIADTVGDDPFGIGDVVHKAFVRVDESGTEAAAATAANLTLCIPPEFIANRPFVFLIRDVKTEMIFFMGRVVDL